MKEHYCSYEQSVALKRLGFDWKCYDFFTEDVKVRLSQITPYPKPKNWNEIIIGGVPKISCPRLDQAQAWLREEKGVLVWATPDKQPIDDDYSDIELTGEWWWEVDGSVREDSGDTYTSYESALSAGIDTALKILEEKK